VRDLDAVLDGRPEQPAPPAAEPDRCNYCSAGIQWLTSSTGKRMPVSIEPDPDRGNVIVRGSNAGVLGPGPAAAARAQGEPLFLHHVVDCPHADRWNAAAREASRRAKPAPTRRRIGDRRG
jgi:hypothetical protein